VDADQDEYALFLRHILGPCNFCSRSVIVQSLESQLDFRQVPGLLSCRSSDQEYRVPLLSTTRTCLKPDISAGKTAPGPLRGRRTSVPIRAPVRRCRLHAQGRAAHLRRSAACCLLPRGRPSAPGGGLNAGGRLRPLVRRSAEPDASRFPADPAAVPPCTGTAPDTPATAGDHPPREPAAGARVRLQDGVRRRCRPGPHRRPVSRRCCRRHRRPPCRFRGRKRWASLLAGRNPTGPRVTDGCVRWVRTASR
jgi:hypothetical protein